MTNREIAQQLNISPAALSFILNNKPGVSDTTRQRVLQQIEEFGYSHLLKKATPAPVLNNNLCFVVYKRHGKILDQHPFFLLIMESIETQARKYGYNILFITMDKRSPIELQISKLNEMSTRGAIIFATEMLTDDIAYFEKLRMPYIAIDNNFPQLNINTVSINNQMGTYQAIEHLVAMGHREIGYLQSNVDICSFGERERGYTDALTQFNLTLEANHIFQIGYTEESSYQDFKQLLSQGIDLPSALVADDDTLVSGVMKALIEKNIRVPEDLSIIGFNDRPSSENSSPPLSSINVSKHSFGAEAVDMLIKLIENNDGTSIHSRSLKLRIGTQLVKRQSVKQMNS